MHRIQIGGPMHHPEPLPLFYDLGGHHTLEDTDEGGILIVAQAESTAKLQEGIQLDQDETYRLFLVLEARFRAHHLPAKGEDPCS